MTARRRKARRKAVHSRIVERVIVLPSAPVAAEAPKNVSPLKRWADDVKEKKARKLVKKPHHYVVAAGVSVVLLAIGGHLFEMVGVWAYAVNENLFGD